MKKLLAFALALIMISGFAFAEVKEPCTITICPQAATGLVEAWEAVGRAYEALNPNVDIVIEPHDWDTYPDWVQTMLQSYEKELPAADLIYGNLAGPERANRVINFLDYLGEGSPYSDCEEWTDQFAFELQNITGDGTLWDSLCVTASQILWFYNVDIFEEVGVQPPTTWEEFTDVCTKLANAGYQPLAVPGDFQSFWIGQMGWLAQIYADQTTRSQIEIVRAQEGDYCYDPAIDGAFTYDPTDPYNDDQVTGNPVRFWKALVEDGTIRADSDGMKTVWSNLAKVFPHYAGGENFETIDEDIARNTFLRQEAAIMLNGSWFFGDYLNVMASIADGSNIIIDENEASVDLAGLSGFSLSTFSMPSMSGAGIEAPARTIEVATGFLSAVKKDPEHDAAVVDFLKFYTSSQGYSTFLNTLIGNRGVPDGLPLIHGVQLEGDLAELFNNIEAIGNCQKGFGAMLARGLGDKNESLQEWYTYSHELFNGQIDVEQWATLHQENQLRYAPEIMETYHISMDDLANPQNNPADGE